MTFKQRSKREHSPASELPDSDKRTETVAYPIPCVSSDPTADQRMRIIEVSGVLAFWDDPREDVYSLDDGKLV